jgi:uncharacterized protein (TIGR00661 family)
MARAIFIIQGEGKGHMSQSIALKEHLEEAGHTVESVFVGGRPGNTVPAYFKEAFEGLMETFQSPYFLRTPNQKGIYLGRSLLANLLRSATYLGEARRISRAIRSASPDVVFNFYDVVGALALRKVGGGIRRIGIGHHFLLHLEGSPCPNNQLLDRWLLMLHTRMIIRSCDRVLALSYREVKGTPLIQVVPPLIRKAFREMKYRPGERYLVYLMAGGYLYDLIRIAREEPGFKADVYTSLSPGIELPAGITLHAFSENRFREMMATCRGLITTAGFDTAAEAAYLGIPLTVIPARNHFEQRCNCLDVERSGIGTAVDHLTHAISNQKKAPDNGPYRKWADRAGLLVLNSLEE